MADQSNVNPDSKCKQDVSLVNSKIRDLTEELSQIDYGEINVDQYKEIYNELESLQKEISFFKMKAIDRNPVKKFSDRDKDNFIKASLNPKRPRSL